MYLRQKQLSIGLVILLLVGYAIPVGASELDVNAEAALLLEADTNQILMSKHEDKVFPIASLSKLMTVFITMEQVEAGAVSLQDKVTITDAAESMGGSQIWLAAGEQLTLKDLLKATLLPSANDASVAVAEYIAGNQYNFIELMNQKARDLSLKNTEFVNSTGLPGKGGNNQSTAYELALMAQKLISQHKQVLNWTSQRVTYINKQRPIYNTNNLIGHYQGADGLQTGWTEEAGYCLIASAKRKNTRLIAVILGAASESARMETARKLFDYGFEAFTKQKLIDAGVKVTTAEVKKGRKLKVSVVTKEKLSAFIKKGTKDQLIKKTNLNPIIKAPLQKNQSVGELIYQYQGQKLKTTALLAAEKVQKADVFTLLVRWIARQWRSFLNHLDKALAN